MKWTGNERPVIPTMTIIAAFMAGALTLFAVSGCGHKSIEDSLAAGDLAMQNSKLADAESDYQEAAASAPNDPRPHIALGNLYIFEQKPAQAQTEYLKAIDLDKTDASAHSALGSAFELEAEPGLAENQYRAAVALAPGNVAYRLNLGTLLQKLGKMGPAEVELRTAVGLEPKNAHAHLALAKLFSAEPDRSADAESEFAQVRILDPSLLPGAPPPPSATEATPEAAPSTSIETTTEPAPTPAAPAAAIPPIRPLDRKFLLTHDSPVYETPQETANVVAQVHQRRFVHVTGIAGNWLRIKMKNGTVGFIPVTAAE